MQENSVKYLSINLNYISIVFFNEQLTFQKPGPFYIPGERKTSYPSNKNFESSAGIELTTFQTRSKHANHSTDGPILPFNFKLPFRQNYRTDIQTYKRPYLRIIQFQTLQKNFSTSKTSQVNPVLFFSGWDLLLALLKL